MKTIIFDGSPHQNGNTAALIQAFQTRIGGDHIHIRAYQSQIRPCIDCRYCRSHPGCAIPDGMQQIYADIQTCNHIIIASPIYFSQLTGPLLSLLSRLQSIWCAKHFRNTSSGLLDKYGGVLLTGGGDGSSQRALETAECLLHIMGAELVGSVVSHQTDRLPASEDQTALAAAKALADKMLLLNHPSGRE